MESDHYIHMIDPVLVELWGPVAIRWYGLSYVAAFLAGFLLLHRWSKAGWYRVPAGELQSLIFYGVIGVMLGGRLGYVLFYDFAQWREEPLLIFQVWRGGMSSHGGMLGLTLAMYVFARQRTIPLLHMMDGLACAAPIGIFFGRCANFINGELWGRATTVSWGVIFPQEVGLFPPQPGLRAEALRLYEAGYLQARHPSQLYAAFVEGLLLFAVMLVLRRSAWASKADGHLCVAFLLLYAAGRFTVEFFREPEIMYFGWLTQGQLLSLLMVVAAVPVWRWAQRVAR